MKRVFVDTFYFLAVLNRHDPAHENALVYHGDPSIEFVTTEWVLTEVADANCTPAMRAGFQKLFELLENDDHVKIIPVTHESIRGGLNLFFKRSDKEWSLTDAFPSQR